MKLYVQVFLMAACVVCAFTLPTMIQDEFQKIEDIDAVYSLLLSQVRSSLIDTRGMTPGEQACADQFNNATTQVNQQITNQTNVCFENANRTTVANKQSANATIVTIRSHLNAVQTQLANCTAMQGDVEFLSCTTANFDSNLSHLDQANSLAYLVQGQISVEASSVNIVRDACVSSVITSAKTNLTRVANEYNACLHNVKNQRPSVFLLH